MRTKICRWGVNLPVCILVGVVAAMLPSEAGAQKAKKTYYVVDIHPEGIDGIVVSVDRRSGAQPGQKIRIFRAIDVKHPVTGRRLRDRFPLGDAELMEVGNALSVCDDLPLEEELDEEVSGLVLKGRGKTVSIERSRRKSRVKVGDQVELVGGPAVVEYATPVEKKEVPWAAAKPTPVTPCPKSECPKCPECIQAPSELDDATVAVLAAWRNTLGNPLKPRIEVWKDFLKAHPDSPYTNKVKAEISSLELQVAENVRLASATAPLVPEAPGMAGTQALQFKHQAVGKLYRYQPLHVAVATSKLEPIRTADMFYRHIDSPTYKKKPMRRNGDAYLRAQLDASELSPPGVEYFIEAVDQEGAVYKVTGSKQAPVMVPVEEPPGLVKTERRNRSKVSLLYEYANFKAGEGRADGPEEDHFQRFEADFLYRIMSILYSIRVGCGVYTGSGGKIDVMEARSVGFNYGYTELEFRFHEYFSVMGRVIIGLNRPPGTQAAGLAGGFEGKIRIGRELGTNLVMGGAILEDIGSLALIELTWDVVKYFPMTGRVEVTTQPVQEDIGVRIIYRLGLTALDWFQPTLDVGLALRRIDHYGVSLGVGTVFQW